MLAAAGLFNGADLEAETKRVSRMLVVSPRTLTELTRRHFWSFKGTTTETPAPKVRSRTEVFASQRESRPETCNASKPRVSLMSANTTKRLSAVSGKAYLVATGQMVAAESSVPRSVSILPRPGFRIVKPHNGVGTG